MKVLTSSEKYCLSCMNEHSVDVVQIEEQDTFKNELVDYVATYEYCSNTDDLSEPEELIRMNVLVVKDAYREKVGLLTSEEIKNIRAKYGISQKDFSDILDWGKATITRYENFQVQDRAHDDILRIIDADPKWLLDKLKSAEGNISTKAYTKYHQKIKDLYNRNKNQYLINAIYAIYANINDPLLTGHSELNLDKVVEVINYFAEKVDDLFKVKLMKLLWYSDMYHYKKHGHSITGLAYCALPLGAVPEGHDQIIDLDGVKYEIIFFNDIAYKFILDPDFKLKKLTDNELNSINIINEEVGHLTTSEIVDKMHEEEAYKKVPKNSKISYTFAETLSIS